MTHVLFVCVGNQGRSVIAERLFREAVGGVYKRNENWHLPDPMGLPLDEVRVIRDEIKRRVDTLLDELATDR